VETLARNNIYQISSLEISTNTVEVLSYCQGL